MKTEESRVKITKSDPSTKVGQPQNRSGFVIPHKSRSARIFGAARRLITILAICR
jgi:hypothetical protein